MAEPTRVAIYARVSTEEQANKYSIEAQIDLCMQYAKENGLLVVAEYREIGASGTKKHRPQLDAMRESARLGEFQTVLVWALDRIARGGAAYYFIHDQLATSGCSLTFVKEGEGKFAGLLAWLGEQEVQAFKERAIAGRQRKAREGKINPPPWSRFGYDYDADSQLFILNEAEAAWVRQIFSWHIAGAGTHVIANRLDAAGVQTRLERWITERLSHLDEPLWCAEHRISDPASERDRLLARLARHGGWQEGTVHALLRSSEYYGRGYASKSTLGPGGKRIARAKEEWIPFPYPAIIDEATFRAAQEVTERIKHVRKRPNDQPAFLLAGLLFCTECQKYFQIHVKQDSRVLKDGSRKYYDGKLRRGYLCGGMRRQRRLYSCRLPASLHAARIEQAVWSKIHAGLQNPALLLASLEVETEVIENAVESASQEIEATKKRMVDLDLQEQRILTVFRNGVIGEAALGVQLAVINEQREALLEQLATHEQRRRQHIDQDELVRRVLRLGEAIAALPEDLTHVSQEQYRHAADIVRLVVDRIRVDGQNNLSIDLVIGEIDPSASTAVPLGVCGPKGEPNSWC